jgi:AraC-like DNA-binding protein
MENTAGISALIDSDLTVSSIGLAQECRRPPDWRLEQKEARPRHGFVFVLEGAALFQFDGQSLTVSKNDIVYLPKGSRYLTRASAHDTYHFITVSFQLAHDAVLSQLPMPIVTKPANPNAYLHLFREVVQRWQRKEILYKLKCQSILAEIMHLLILEIVQERSDHHLMDKIRPAVEIMERQYTESLSIETLADRCALSTSHFRRLFRKAYGLSPQQYLLNLRINKAKDLIRSQLYTMTEVAERSGFANIYYFSRTFRQATGVPPTEYSKL